MSEANFIQNFIQRDHVFALKHWDKDPESGFYLVSIHKTQEGANKSLLWHKMEDKKKESPFNEGEYKIEWMDLFE